MSDTARLIRNALNTNRILTVALQPRYDPVIERLTREQDALDGFSTTASGSDKGRSGKSTTSRTEGTAIDLLEGRLKPTAALDEGLDLALAASNIMRLLHTWCDTYGEQLTATDLNRLRCTNWRHDDRNSCGNIATPRRHNGTTIDDGRCLPCGQIADRLDDEKRKEGEDRRQRMAQTQRTLYRARTGEM